MKRLVRNYPDWHIMRGMAKDGECLTKALMEDRAAEVCTRRSRINQGRGSVGYGWRRSASLRSFPTSRRYWNRRVVHELDHRCREILYFGQAGKPSHCLGICQPPALVANPPYSRMKRGPWPQPASKPPMATPLPSIANKTLFCDQSRWVDCATLVQYRRMVCNASSRIAC